MSSRTQRAATSAVAAGIVLTRCVSVAAVCEAAGGADADHCSAAASAVTAAADSHMHQSRSVGTAAAVTGVVAYSACDSATAAGSLSTRCVSVAAVWHCAHHCSAAASAITVAAIAACISLGLSARPPCDSAAGAGSVLTRCISVAAASEAGGWS